MLRTRTIWSYLDQRTVFNSFHTKSSSVCKKDFYNKVFAEKMIFGSFLFFHLFSCFESKKHADVAQGSRQRANPPRGQRHRCSILCNNTITCEKHLHKNLLSANPWAASALFLIFCSFWVIFLEFFKSSCSSYFSSSSSWFFRSGFSFFASLSLAPNIGGAKKFLEQILPACGAAFFCFSVLDFHSSWMSNPGF